MNCPNCKTDLKKHFLIVWKIAYKEGYEKANKRCEKAIKNIERTNKELLEEIRREDSSDPVFGLAISLSMAKTIIRELKSKKQGFGTRKPHIIKFLKKQIKKINAETINALEKYIEGKERKEVIQMRD